MYADVGPERPADMSPIARRTLPAPDPQAEGAEGGGVDPESQRYCLRDPRLRPAGRCTDGIPETYGGSA